MRIKNQFRLSLILFLIVLVIITGSIVVTEQQTAQLGNQETMTGVITNGASNLNYISNNYFLYQDNSSIALWQSQYSSLSNDIAKIGTSNSNEKFLIEAIKADLNNIQTVFSGVILFLQNSPRNLSVRAQPEFQTQWSRMVVQIQALSFDSGQLSAYLNNKSSQLTFNTILLVVALLGLFGAYLVTNYFLTSRKTLGSIAKLEDGLGVIGSGDLNHAVKAGKNDEIAEISESVNRMAGNLKSVMSSKTDLEKEVAERKMVEEALRESEALYRTLFDNSEDGFVLLEPILDENGKPFDFRFLKVNNAYEQQTGAKAVDVVGRRVCEVVPEIESDVILLSGEVAKTGKAKHFEGFNKLSLRWFDSYYFPFAKGKVGVLFRDITERKKLEEQLKEGERLSAIGATAGMVGHDIRNPLQAITGEVYLLKTDLEEMHESETKEEVKESIDSIEKNIEYINKIVADLQDFARPLKPEYTMVDLTELVSSIFKAIRLPVSIKPSFDLKEAAKLKTDSTFLRRALTNLVNNSIQAMPNGGILEITSCQKENKAVIGVSDTGAGIPEEIKRKLFTPMITTKSKGQGFGLAVSKRLIEAMNGSISFESEKGKGTKFTIELPISQETRV